MLYTHRKRTACPVGARSRHLDHAGWLRPHPARDRRRGLPAANHQRPPQPLNTRREPALPTATARPNFRSDADWAKVQEAAGGRPERLEIKPRWAFERLKIIPQDWRRDLLQLIIGSHDPALQEEVNQLAPVQVFNLSITRPEVIDDTHRRMAAAYHPSGGPWRRGHMPRTTLVFLNEEPGLSVSERRAAARDEAKLALGAYWTALEGTLDPAKVNNAADNALIGDADEVAEQIVARFHPEDRLMLWFDFFNHDSERVIRDQRAFMERVVPKVAERLAARATTEAP